MTNYAAELIMELSRWEGGGGRVHNGSPRAGDLEGPAAQEDEGCRTRGIKGAAPVQAGRLGAHGATGASLHLKTRKEEPHTQKQ